MAIGRTNAGGGGTSLNFKIVSGGSFPPSMTRNMIPDTYAKTATYNGITYTVNGDGSITANGTATATSTCNVWGENNSLTLPAGTYTLSGCPAGGSQNTYMLCSNDTVRKDTGSGASFTLSADTAISFKIRIDSGTTVSNLKFWPQLEQGSTKTSFVKYAQKENTIWVNTDVAIPSWAFSATEPESPVAGMVWISTGTSSLAEFNALRKNTITVCPLAAKQYVGSKWVDVEAKIYQGGEWVSWKTYIYNHGDKCTDLGGNWVPLGKNISGGSGAQAPAISFGDTSMVITQEARGGIAYKENRIDLSGVSTLKVKGSVTNAAAMASWRSLNVWTSLGTYIDDNRAAYLEFGLTNGALDLSLDVSGLTGTYYIGFGLYNTPTTLTIEEVELA